MLYSALDCAIPASAISHCLGACLYGTTECLIVAKSNILEIYEIESSRLLTLVSRIRFQDRIASVARLAQISSNGQNDRLLFSFREAKAAIMEWDSEVRQLVNTSLHFFERLEYVTAFRTDEMPPCKLAVDPEGRCAVSRVYQEWLAVFILPPRFLKRSTVLAEDEDLMKQSANEQNITTEMLQFSSLDARIRHVVDFAFLPGFHEPTIAILYSATPSTCTRLEASKDTCALVIVSMDMHKQAFSTIAFFEALPFDCHRLLALPRSLGGVLVVSGNALIHVEPGSPGCGIAVNAFAERCTSFRLTRSPLTIAGLEGCSLTLLDDQRHLLLLTINGDAFGVRFEKTGRHINRMHLQPTPHSLNLSGPACLASVGGAMLFFGSLAADGKLLAVRIATSTAAPNTAFMDIDDELYGTSTSRKESAISHTSSIDVLDTLYSLGPASDIATWTEHRLVVPSGRNSECRLNILHTRLSPLPTASLHIRNARSLWTLLGSDGNAAYLLVSTDVSSMLMRATSDGLAEVDESGFYLEGPSFLATSNSSPAGEDTPLLYVQVYAGGVRILDASTLRVVGETRLQILSPIVKAAFFENMLLILLASGDLLTYSLAKNCTLVPFSFSERRFSCFCFAQTAAFGAVVILMDLNGTMMIVGLSSGTAVFTCAVFAILPPILTSIPETQLPMPRDDTVRDFAMISHSHDCGCLLDHLMVMTKSGTVRVYRWIDGSFFVVDLLNDPLTADPVAIQQVGETLFLSGATPYMLYIGRRRYPRVHPFARALLSMASFPTKDDSSQIVFLDADGNIGIGALPPDLDYDADVPVHRSAPLLPSNAVKGNDADDQNSSGSASFIAYHEPSDAFAVAIARPTPFVLPQDEFAPISDNVDWTPISGAPEAVSFAFEMLLVSPLSWTAVDKYALEPFEHATGLQACSLETRQTATGRKPFLVLGTAYAKSEDRPSRGRILVFDIMEVVPEEGRPHTNRRLRLLRAEPVRGPVTAFSAINGHLLAAIGTKIIIHSFEGNESLDGVAFVDVSTYVRAVSVAKSFFAVGDIASSVSFMVFQEDPPKIAILGKDFRARSTNVSFLGLLTNGPELAIVAADLYDGLHLFSYAPTNLASVGGERLMERGSIALGSAITSMQRLVTAGTSRDSRIDSNSRLALVLTTIDGTTHTLHAIPESTFRPLSALQSRLVGHLPTPGGLHPRLARLVSQWALRPLPPARTVLDVVFLKQFWSNARLGAVIRPTASTVNPDSTDLADSTDDEESSGGSEGDGAANSDKREGNFDTAAAASKKEKKGSKARLLIMGIAAQQTHCRHMKGVEMRVLAKEMHSVLRLSGL